MLCLSLFCLGITHSAAQRETLTAMENKFADPLSKPQCPTGVSGPNAPLNLYKTIQPEMQRHLNEDVYGLATFIVENHANMSLTLKQEQSMLWGGKYVVAPDPILQPFSISSFSCAGSSYRNEHSCKGVLIYEADNGHFEFGITFGRMPNGGSQNDNDFGFIYGAIDEVGAVSMRGKSPTVSRKGATHRFFTYRLDVMPGLISKCVLSDAELSRRRAEYVSSTVSLKNLGIQPLLLSNVAKFDGFWCDPPMPVVEVGQEISFKACGYDRIEVQMVWSYNAVVLKMAWSQAAGSPAEGATSLGHAETATDDYFPQPVSLKGSTSPIEFAPCLRSWTMPAGPDQIVFTMQDTARLQLVNSSMEMAERQSVMSEKTRLPFLDIVRIDASILVSILACAVVFSTPSLRSRMQSAAGMPLLHS